MQDKQKVTLYLPPELHRNLKIRSATDSQPMSEIAEKALEFYLSHSEVVDGVDAPHGKTHRVYSCPDCSTPLVLRNDELQSVGSSDRCFETESLEVDRIREQLGSHFDRGSGEQLVVCSTP